MKHSIRIVAVIAAMLLIGLAACSGDEKDTTAAVTVTSAQALTDATDAVDAYSPVTWEQGDTEKPGSTQKSGAGSKTTSPAATGGAVKQTTVRRSVTTAPVAVTTSAAPAPSAKTVKVTVKEGQTLTQIFTLLEEKGVCSFDALMDASQNYDYSYYPLVAKIPSGSNRCFRLEGYLFPDTYEFYIGEKPQDAIGRFLRVGKVKITDEMMSRASQLGYSMDEVLAVASIIQKEGSKSSEVSKVAAIIYNRLKAGKKLQMDSTINYIEKNVKPYLSGDINRYNSFYNTYKCSALPAGPIANPGLTTINAALYPADVPYMYFCHDANANYYYAVTYDEHLENLKKAGIE